MFGWAKTEWQAFQNWQIKEALSVLMLCAPSNHPRPFLYHGRLSIFVFCLFSCWDENGLPVASQIQTTITLLVSLASYMYILVSLYSTFTHFSHFTYVYNNLHLLTLPSHLGIGETIYHLFHYTLLHSAKDKWTNNLYVTLSDVRGTFPASPPYCKKLNYSSQFY